MSEYYYISSLLPPLEIGHLPTLNTLELKDLLAINLSEKDLERVKRFFSLVDMENLRAFWTKEAHDPRGNYTRHELEEALVHQAWPGYEEFPEYLKDFLDKYRDTDSRITHFAFLMSDFLKIESEKEEEGFLKSYFAFERELRLVMVGFRAKKFGLDVSRELQYEDPTEPIVAEILAQKDAQAYEPPFEFKELKPIFMAFADFPIELHKAILAYSFNRVQELYANEIFSLDRILGYLARLRLVEEWLELDMQEGMKIIDKIEGKVE